MRILKFYASQGPNFVEKDPRELIGGSTSAVDVESKNVKRAVKAVKKIDRDVYTICDEEINYADVCSKALKRGTREYA